MKNIYQWRVYFDLLCYLIRHLKCTYRPSEELMWSWDAPSVAWELSVCLVKFDIESLIKRACRLNDSFCVDDNRPSWYVALLFSGHCSRVMIQFKNKSSPIDLNGLHWKMRFSLKSDFKQKKWFFSNWATFLWKKCFPQYV